MNVLRRFITAEGVTVIVVADDIVASTNAPIDLTPVLAEIMGEAKLRALFRSFRATARRTLPPPVIRCRDFARAKSRHVHARHGFHQMARLPCYRAVRVRP